ncbi:conserved hypothetical protein [uncultured Paludibacter sp.]|uniref:Lipoprotein n=1 Tax=uncultured Paludibacter sp. TaxID=497635 RepID=A0A653AKN2_9BACT|nr:conserved hypothetical protein [uncultured Paludibacter sp.]
MKFNSFFVLFIILSFGFVSCVGDMTTDLVKEIQPTGDQITIKTDTFHISTETQLVESIISRPDSFLLGSFKDDVYGNTKADILTQFYYPVNYKYMDSSLADTEPDSVVLTLNYYAGSYFGESNSPIEFSVYELKDSLKYSENYKTDINPSSWVDFSKSLGTYVETVDSTSEDSRTGLNSVRIKLSEEFLHRFFSSDDAIFQSDAKFLDFFKGLYITTTLGSATLINVNNVQMNLYCHYTYKSTNEKVNFTLNFSATEEIKRVNRIQHPNRNAALLADADLNYVCAPANYYTRLRIPIGRMRDRVKVTGKRLVVNSSILTVNVADKDSMGTSLPYVENMLLIKEDKMNDFFANKELPSDTVAFVSSLSKSATSATTYKYYYKFSSLANLILDEITNTSHDELNLLLIPVKLKYDSSSSSIIEVIPSNSMEAAAVYSGKNSRVPMKMEVIFSGF